MNPETMKFSKSHEWVMLKDGIATIGISDHAQHELNDIVFVELPPVGKTLSAGKEFGVVESVKTASDVFSPVSGDVVETNLELEVHPEYINQDPYGTGWMIKVKCTNLAEIDTLMDHTTYQKSIASE